MTPEQKHARADALKPIIEQQKEIVGKLRRSDQVEVSYDGRGYNVFKVAPFHRETDTKGDYLYTPLENRLSTNLVHNVVVRFVEELIQASEKELAINENEYAALFSAE